MSMLCVPAHMNAHTTASGKKKPAALPALIPASRTSGATPTMPIPFAAAAIVPAVWVPWPLSSFQAAGLLSGAPLTQDALSAKSTFGARSGCVQSRPVSMSPTTTSGLPPVIACASGAWICVMSHCRPASESAPGAAAGTAAAAPLGSEAVRPRGAADVAVLAHGRGEARVAGPRDDDADLAVVRDERAAGVAHGVRCAGGRCAVPVQHEVGRVDAVRRGGDLGCHDAGRCGDYQSGRGDDSFGSG